MKLLLVAWIIVCLSPWPAMSVYGSVAYHKPLMQCLLSHRMDCE